MTERERERERERGGGGSRSLSCCRSWTCRIDFATSPSPFITIEDWPRSTPRSMASSSGNLARKSPVSGRNEGDVCYESGDQLIRRLRERNRSPWTTGAGPARHRHRPVLQFPTTRRHRRDHLDGCRRRRRPQSCEKFRLDGSIQCDRTLQL